MSDDYDDETRKGRGMPRWAPLVVLVAGLMAVGVVAYYALADAQDTTDIAGKGCLTMWASDYIDRVTCEGVYQNSADIQILNEKLDRLLAAAESGGVDG